MFNTDSEDDFELQVLTFDKRETFYKLKNQIRKETRKVNMILPYILRTKRSQDEL